MFSPEEKSSPLKPILSAAAVLLIAAAVFYFFTFRKATITTTKTQIYSAHTVTQAQSGVNNVVGQLGESSDDLFVTATIHIVNKTGQPLTPTTATATYTDSTDATLDTPALGFNQILRTEAIFPDLTAMLPRPLALTTDINPGTAVDAQLIFHFIGLTEANWKSRKSATLTLNFAHQPSQTIPLL